VAAEVRLREGVEKRVWKDCDRGGEDSEGGTLGFVGMACLTA